LRPPNEIPKLIALAALPTAWGETMSLTFAYKWNQDNESFTYQDARALLRSAIVHPNGESLKIEIDEGIALVIAGPHRTRGGDTRRHVTVHCASMWSTFHLYISKQGNLSGINREPQSSMKTKPGHVFDDRNAPFIPDSNAL
jgi:hypothetical protein